MTDLDLLTLEWQSRVDSFGAYLDTLASNPILPDPDVERMAESPAATCAGAVNLLDAVNERNAA